MALSLSDNVKLRGTVRSGFTKQLNSIKEELKEDTPDKKKLQISLSMSEDKHKQLVELNYKILLQKIENNADDLDGESEVADGYVRQSLETQVNVYELINVSSNDIDNNSSISEVNIKRKFKLPKLELYKFDDEIKNWLQFWCQFEKIHEDSDIVPSDKFQYLIQATVKGSRAREIVESFSPTGDNYAKVIDSLKSRFGREDLLVEVYIRELLKLVLKNSSSRNNSSSMCSLYDSLESHIRALETLNVTTEKCAAMLYPLVESCMPEEFLRAWQRSSKFIDGAEPKNRLDNLMEFLKSEVESEERINLALSGFELKTKIKKQGVSVEDRLSTAAGLLSTSPPFVKGCVFCNGQHESFNCFNAQKINLVNKQKILKQKGCCFKCFKRGRCSNKCNAFIRCLVCNKEHATLMCPEIFSNKNVSRGPIDKRDKKEEKTESSTQKTSDQNAVNLSSLSHNPKVILQTLVVKLKGPHSCSYVRALIDTGSEKSYILKRTAEYMDYESLREELVTHSLFGGKKTSRTKHMCYKIYLESLDRKFLCNFDVLDEPIICENIRSVQKGPWINELKDMKISISDIDEKPGPIEVLIGADVAGRLLTGCRRKLSCNLVAIETYLGWTLMGKVPINDVHEKSDAMVLTSLFSKEFSITDLWSLDAIGITDPIIQKSQEEKERESKISFLDSVTVNNEGRYEVSLPWTEERLPISSNENIALKRLETMTKRLDSDNLFTSYNEVFKDWSTLGIIEEVSMNSKVDSVHYLPHRPVLKENSTTKVRPVFDASAREKSSPSLNQCLECGPNLVKLIPDILLRFREQKYGVIADIEKAFLQISIRPECRDLLRFFWWSDEDERKLKILRHARLVFGLKCSPFILAVIIEFHLLKYADNPCYDKAMITKLLHSFYVDNVVTSFSNKDKLIQFIHEAKDAMEKGKFNLRDWQHSEDNVEPAISPVLGLFWDRQKDTLALNLGWLENFELGEITKRTILSIAHKVFDPIGLASPVFLLPKLLLQRMWKDGISWDEEVDDNIRKEFSSWFSDLSYLKQIFVRRWFCVDANCKTLSIHTFCDASQHAYAATTFVRISTAEGVEVHLLAAKSRVAPVKIITIPRLELIAATVGARLCASVMKGLLWENVKLYFWTDSSTVFNWIQREESWTVFVSNRVKEIRKITDPNSWKHVPGTKNPADLPSRGCSAKHILKTKWWEGPSWLKETEDKWPSSNIVADENAIAQEKRKSKMPVDEKSVKCLTNQTTFCEWCNSPKHEKNSGCKYHGCKWYFRFFSNYDKIVRLVAWIHRFIHNCKITKISRLNGELSLQEINAAEKVIVRLIQDESFTSENKSKLDTLDVYKDEHGLLRLKTKIVYRKDAEDFRRPMILPSDHPVVRRLIMTEHRKNSHAGSQILLNILREHYWILNARKTIRSVISKCVICIRQKRISLNAPVAALPENRIKDAAVFEITGFDLAGPLYLKGGSKAWVCLYTCAIYRAVHLELLSSLSTEVFLQSFRRFIARRGRPSTVYCDNGSNFIGASNALKEVDWNKVIQYSTTRKIEWFFNPPTASWWGGFWKRLVGVMKSILRRVLGKSSVSYEEMTTILCDTESIINSRPLTYISESNGELVPLYPALFIQDVKQMGVPDFDVVDKNKLNRKFKYRQKLISDLRNRFRSEYLGLLIQRPQYKKCKEQIQLGDVVLIGRDNTKRIDWPLGRVIELIPGKDGVTRLVRLQTSTSEVLRPIQRIYPLEVSSTWSEERKELYSFPTVQTVSKDEPVKHTRCGWIIKVPQKLDL